MWKQMCRSWDGGKKTSDESSLLKNIFLMMELSTSVRRSEIVYWITIWNQVPKRTSTSRDLGKLTSNSQENIHHIARAIILTDITYQFTGWWTDRGIITTITQINLDLISLLRQL